MNELILSPIEAQYRENIYTLMSWSLMFNINLTVAVLSVCCKLWQNVCMFSILTTIAQWISSFFAVLIVDLYALINRLFQKRFEWWWWHEFWWRFWRFWGCFERAEFDCARCWLPFIGYQQRWFGAIIHFICETWFKFGLEIYLICIWYY